MNIEFHYYTIHYLANYAGFNSEDAFTIAYSSQFVDNNILPYDITTEKGLYSTPPTQDYGFWTKNSSHQIYYPFHFFPGDINYTKAARKDGKKNKLNTTPGSPLLRQLLQQVLKSRNLFRIGIALHTYADSWAHQNFSGRIEDWNKIEEPSLIPAIGHAQVLRNTDLYNKKWEDPRLHFPYIDNNKRFFQAARMIYKFLCTYNRIPFDDIDTVISRLEYIITSGKTVEERISTFALDELIPKYDRMEWLDDALVETSDPGEIAGFNGFNKLLWLKDTLLHKSRILARQSVLARSHFFTSPFYRFIEASKNHRAEALKLLEGII